MSAPRFSPGGYIPVICACIRDHADPAVIAVPDPTCPRHAPQVRQGIEPTFVIYDETVQADRDAARAATSLGRLITLTLALAIALTPAALAPGTWTATTGLLLGTALAARVLYVATTSKEN